jgi:hypothetical protein
MLQPDDRKLLAELLEAPDGYRLEHAIATTFTLDLTALLTVPLGFSGTDLMVGTNKLALLQSIQEYADKIDVFYQRGMLKVPQKNNSLLAFLEPVVHSVAPPPNGYLFHPKIWVLRYSAIEQDADTVEKSKFRLICGSRNLTFDRSWDAAITLDGEERNRTYAYNNPLCRFLQTLPGRTEGLSPERQQQMDDTISQLNNVEWEKPEGVVDDKDWLQFHIFGEFATRVPDRSGNRILVVSPFVNSAGLMQFDAKSPLAIISGDVELDGLDESGREWAAETSPNMYVLNDSAAIWDIDDEEAGARWDLTGLHAKLYVFDRGHYAHVLIGSANATDRGWGGNDEILVEIRGKKKVFGIDSFIGDKTEFRKILLEHSLGQQPAVDPDDELRRQLENKIREFAGISFSAKIVGSDVEGWKQTVASAGPLSLSIPDVSIEFSLVTTPHHVHVLPNGDSLNHEWILDGIEKITPFVVLTLRSKNVHVSTVLLARMEGDPEDRLDQVIARQFENKEMFLQFVALLLASRGAGVSDRIHDGFDVDGGISQSWMSDGSGLLEILLRSLSRSPESVDEVGRLVERLRATSVGKDVLPDGWEELWQAVVTTRKWTDGKNDRK